MVRMRSSVRSRLSAPVKTSQNGLNSYSARFFVSSVALRFCAEFCDRRGRFLSRFYQIKAYMRCSKPGRLLRASPPAAHRCGISACPILPAKLTVRTTNSQHILLVKYRNSNFYKKPARGTEHSVPRAAFVEEDFCISIIRRKTHKKALQTGW